MNACGGSMGKVGDDVFNSDWLIIKRHRHYDYA